MRITKVSFMRFYFTFKCYICKIIQCRYNDDFADNNIENGNLTLRFYSNHVIFTIELEHHYLRVQDRKVQMHLRKFIDGKEVFREIISNVATLK